LEEFNESEDFNDDLIDYDDIDIDLEEDEPWS
jgi:hypothetical protein